MYKANDWKTGKCGLKFAISTRKAKLDGKPWMWRRSTAMTMTDITWSSVASGAFQT